MSVFCGRSKVLSLQLGQFLVLVLRDSTKKHKIEAPKWSKRVLQRNIPANCLSQGGHSSQNHEILVNFDPSVFFFGV